ncbi:hypothetical protein [Brevundimonas sp. GCM10030266]|uniref:hypothetical protein n=1 Tax=Brevundimonas sp. GCM10030266 TaxID=3273386 RepID=UPI003610F154
MRTALILAPIALGLALSACATSPGSETSTEQRLAEECSARGGILVRTTGAPTGRPEQDNACQIRGVPSSIR